MRHDDVRILINGCVAKVGMMKLFFPVGWSELAEKIDQVTSSVFEHIKFVVNVFFLIVQEWDMLIQAEVINTRI